MVKTDYRVKMFTLYVEDKEYFISFKNKLNGVEVVLVSVPDNNGRHRLADFECRNHFKTNKDYITAVLVAIACDIRRFLRSALNRLKLKK